MKQLQTVIVGVVTVAVLTAVKLLVPPLGEALPFLLYFGAALVAAWSAGRSAGLFTTVLATLVANYFFLPPRGALSLGAFPILQSAVFITECVVIVLLVDGMKTSRERVECLQDVARALSAVRRREEAAAVIADQCLAAAHADTCTLYALDESGQALELLADRGVAPEILAQIQRLDRDPDNAAWQVFENGGSIWVENEREYVSYDRKLATTRATGQRARAFWCVPLVVEGRSIGLLGVGYYEPRKFSPDERAFVTGLAQQCAQALQRAQSLDAEERARLTSERASGWLETTLKSIGDAVIATDAEGRITFVNPVAAELTGYEEREVRGRPLSEVVRLINEYTREEVESPVDRVLREGTVVGLANHTILVGRHGEVPIDDSGAPIRDASGAITGVVLVFRSVSREKLAEHRREFLEAASAELAASLDYRATLARVAKLTVPGLADWCAIDILEEGQDVPERIAVSHVDPTKIELAKQLYRQYPPAPDARIGVPNVVRTGRPELYAEVTDELLVANAVDDEHLRLLRGLQIQSLLIVPLASGEQVFGAMTLVYAEHNRQYTEDDLAFVADFARRAAIAIENARLYASERKQRSLADAANRAKDEFLATVSHELRTPLNAILGWAHMLSRADLDADKRCKAAEIIERNSVAMAQLIDDLLDVSRIVSGKLRLDVELLDPRGVVEEAIESVRPAADAKDIRIALETATTSDRVMGDPARLQQIVWNLLSNAVKFTPKQGDITVGLRRAESSIEIAVADTGRGIEPRFLPHVFDAFRQADGSVSRSHGGIGLGLAITRHLVELHGGHIDARSEGADRGSVFRVVLPVPTLGRDTERPSRPHAPSPVLAKTQAAPALGGLRVLVVDDEDDARQLVSTVLQRRGAIVTCAESVEQALQLFEAEPIDVVVSDIGMPGRSGYELMRAIRASPGGRGRNVPAAALTAYARPQDRQAAIEAGYVLHLSKPVDPTELVDVVANLGTMSRTMEADS